MSSGAIAHDARYRANNIYLLPSDQTEAERVQWQHDLVRGLFEERTVFAPVEIQEGDEVLDVGAGSGTWVVDFIAKHPNASKADITAIDISPRLFPALPPANAQFITMNALDLPSTWDNRFAFVVQRTLMTALQYDHWQTVVANIHRVTKPGGWVQFLEPNVISGRTGDNCGPIATKFIQMLNRLEKAVNLDLDCALRLPLLLKSAGFVNVRTDHRIMDPGDWNGPEGRKYIDMKIGFFRALKSAVLTHGGFDIVSSEREFDELADGLKEEWSAGPSVTTGWYYIIGQKAEN